MTATSAPRATPALPPAPSEGLQLQASPRLESIPLHPPLAASRPASRIATPAEPARSVANSPLWLLVGLAALASAGWLLERRRRRELETEKDSLLWADVPPPGARITPARDDDAPAGQGAGSQPAVAAALPPTTAGARREATLTDLHELDGRLRRRRASGDLLAATLLLQQHIADFRYTSPWVFLELRELYHLLARERDWELAREVFQLRFGQRAPVWQAPSTAEAQLVEDPVIGDEIVPLWPYREARVAMLRWVLGEPETPVEPHRPPVLALGVYRDLLFLDRLLDRVLITRPPAVDSLL